MPTHSMGDGVSAPTRQQLEVFHGLACSCRRSLAPLQLNCMTLAGRVQRARHRLAVGKMTADEFEPLLEQEEARLSEYLRRADDLVERAWSAWESVKWWMLRYCDPHPQGYPSTYHEEVVADFEALATAIHRSIDLDDGIGDSLEDAVRMDFAATGRPMRYVQDTADLDREFSQANAGDLSSVPPAPYLGLSTVEHDLEVRNEGTRLFRGDAMVDFGGKAKPLLLVIVLLKADGNRMSRDAMMDAIYGTGKVVSDNSLNNMRTSANELLIDIGLEIVTDTKAKGWVLEIVGP